MFLISEAFAQAAPTVPAGPSILESMLPLVVIFAIFYFLLIRPQQKKLKTHDEMVNSLKKGDEILTGGGIIGKIAKVEDDFLLVKIASDVEVKVSRATIVKVIEKPSKLSSVGSSSKKAGKSNKKSESKSKKESKNKEDK